MIVKCIKVLGDLLHEPFEAPIDSKFMVGNYYYVLGLVIKTGQEPDLILRADDNGIPVLAQITHFETYTGYVPPNWLFWYTLEHGLYIQPVAWLEKDRFWEEYYQGNYIAQRLFDREVRIMIESEPAPPEILHSIVYPIPQFKNSNEQDYILRLWGNVF